MSHITLRLRGRLVKDSLSSVLTAAGFCVLPEMDRRDDHVIVIRDFDDYCDLTAPGVDPQRDAKIVVLASEAESLQISAEQIRQLKGVLTYSLSADAFVRSLRLICSGQRVFPSDLALRRRSSAPAPSTNPRPAGARLSPREKEVLLHLTKGHSNKEIARHLGMSEATVKVHVKSLMRKVNVDNRTQAAIWALANLPELDTTSRGLV